VTTKTNQLTPGSVVRKTRALPLSDPMRRAKLLLSQRIAWDERDSMLCFLSEGECALTVWRAYDFESFEVEHG